MHPSKIMKSKQMLESLRNKRILLVVAHPDDEVLGPGGTMFKLIKYYNCIVKLLILGEGLTSRGDVRNTSSWEKELQIHRSNIDSASKIIGFNSNSIYEFPDNRFDSVDLIDIVKVIEKENKIFKSDSIFTHHGGDLNIDHQKTFEAVMTAVRPMNEQKTSSIITFETVSGTEWQSTFDPRKFNPNMFIELTEKEVKTKCDAMDCYEFEKREYPHPRSREALKVRAKMWGIAHGVEYAEAFQIIRMIKRNEQ